jgi:hypothetical protein
MAHLERTDEYVDLAFVGLVEEEKASVAIYVVELAVWRVAHRLHEFSDDLTLPFQRHEINVLVRPHKGCMCFRVKAMPNREAAD